MSQQVLGTPWGAFCGEGEALLRNERLRLEASVLLPTLAGWSAVDSSWGQGQPAARCANLSKESVWDIPLAVQVGHTGRLAWKIHGESGELALEGLPVRVPAEERETCPREQWLKWQLQRYSELAEYESEHKEFGVNDFLEGATPHGARRVWASVEEFWRQSGEDSAELALIVRLARDARLSSALQRIERAPRKMLYRDHQYQRIDRIQEMDSATLRAYSRAPGRSAAEKAGSKQELLAVVRQDTIDLPENRVTRWVASRLRRMAQAYCQRNARFQESARFRTVQSLQRLCERLLSSHRFEGVAPLPHHLSSPTYCLQFESRYRFVWKAYCLIRKQDRLEDDAWKWQSHLWGTTARCIAGAMLLGLKGWSERRVSTPYFLQEGVCGDWTEGPFAPGPLQTPFGECVVADSRSPVFQELTEALEMPSAIRSACSDWALVWPERNCAVLLWSAVRSSARGSVALSADALSRRLGQVGTESGWRLSSVLLIAEPDSARADEDCIEVAADGVTVVWVPEDVHSRWETIQVSLQLGVEELLDG